MKYSSRNSEKISVALTSVVAGLALTGMKIGVGVWTGSLGILSEAAHSGLDMIAALITFLAVRFSDRPADKDHLYGHGKVENISALIETLLLLITCGWIISEAMHRILAPDKFTVEVNFWSFFVIIVSIIVDYSRSRALSKAAKKHKSQALEADALHFSTDIWSSGVVFFGLVFTLFQIQYADSVAALIVAMIVIFISLSLGKRAIDELLDRAPKGVEELVVATALRVDGVEKVDNTRIRNSGSKTFVDLSLHIRRTAPFAIVHHIVHQVETLLYQAIPNADVMIHAEPIETTDETIVDKVKMILSRQNFIAHDVQVFQISGKYQVEFQLEFGRQQDFVHAHAIVDGIEEQIKKEISGVFDVIIHLEESKENVVTTEDVTDTSSKLIAQITTYAMAEEQVSDCRVVSVLNLDGEYRISMKCTVDKSFSLEKVHTITSMLESKLMIAFPYIKEINIHAEPSVNAQSTLR